MGCEVVYGTRSEAVEGIVSWGKDTQSLSTRVVELVFDLGFCLRLNEEANEGGELAIFGKDSSEVSGA